MRKLIQPFLLFFLAFIVFHSWFLSGLLSTYDFPYFSPLMMKDAGMIPYAWGWHVGLDGFAKFISPYSWVFPLIYIPQVVFGSLGMDWSFIERVMYLYPLFILMIASPILLTRYIFPKNRFYLLSVLIFSFNTYTLMLASGEVFLALAYALSPMILMIFMKIVENKEQIAENKKQVASIKYSIILGLLLSIQIMLDPRISYVTLSAVALYAVLRTMNYVLSKKTLTKRIFYILYSIFYIFIIPGAIAVLLHAFWIIPSVSHGGNPVEVLGSAHSSAEAVRYFSFAKFENTISLLHPNWPENVFGKVGFMKPEFLMLPILAYLSLLFVSIKQKTENREQRAYILYFAFLGLVGAFLAKGANDPFGSIYLWMFNHIPGFIMYRDPTKWYLLVAISYSVLIPFSICKTYEMFKSRSKFSIFNFQFSIKSRIFNFQNVFLLSVFCYLLFLIWHALFGQLGGMFKATNVPQDYVKLEKFLASQPDYFRTLWYPSKQKFGYYSNTHPEISAQNFLKEVNHSQILKNLRIPATEKRLQESAVKYIIVPFDSEGEIFLTDRKYDNRLYLKTINQLKAIKWLRQIDCSIVKLLNCSENPFGKIVVFEISNPQDHFYISKQQSATSNLPAGEASQKITYRYVSPVEYLVKVKDAKKGDTIVFSESFDSKWVASSVAGIKYKVVSIKYGGIFNSFILPADGNYSLRVYYTLQDYANIGLAIGMATLVICLSLLLINKKMLLFR